MGDSSIGRLIKKHRESLGLSQARLGELVGRSASTIRNWERDRTSPSERSDVVALAAILGLDERDALDQAGFDVAREIEHPTLEQAFASLGPHPEEVVPVEDDRPEDDPAEMVADDEVDDVPPSGQGQAAESVGVSEPGITVPPPGEPMEAPEPGGADRFESDQGSPTRVPIGQRASPLGPEGEDEPAPRRVVERAAPPTVLETAPAAEPSYLEDPEERQQYHLRALVTAIAIVVLVIVLVWSFHRTTNALGDLWNQFVSMLDL